MGETGCGKSSLISGMCAVLGWTLNVLNVHNGLSYNAIVEWIGEQASACFSDETRTSVIFLDEINACCSVGEAIESFGGEEKACNLFLLYCSFPLSVVFSQGHEVSDVLIGVLVPHVTRYTPSAYVVSID